VQPPPAEVDAPGIPDEGVEWQRQWWQQRGICLHNKQGWQELLSFFNMKLTAMPEQIQWKYQICVGDH
jgi:hypothetical protein